jgi:putative FmdB family regulatory protein
MPIYAYKCSACGHAKDVLQKVSDDALSVCPACGAAAFTKQLTAAGFQLKGSGWYVTDFRGGNQAAAKKEGEAAGDAAKPDAAAADKTPAADKPAATTDKAVAPAAPAPAPAAAPAAAPAPVTKTAS